MASLPVTKEIKEYMQLEHDNDLSAKRVIDISNLIPAEYDEIALTYVTVGNGIGEIETVVYKNSTVTVATLTLSYDSENRLNGVVRS